MKKSELQNIFGLNGTTEVERTINALPLTPELEQFISNEDFKILKQMHNIAREDHGNNIVEKTRASKDQKVIRIKQASAALLDELKNELHTAGLKISTSVLADFLIRKALNKLQ